MTGAGSCRGVTIVGAGGRASLLLHPVRTRCPCGPNGCSFDGPQPELRRSQVGFRGASPSHLCSSVPKSILQRCQHGGRCVHACALSSCSCTRSVALCEVFEKCASSGSGRGKWARSDGFLCLCHRKCWVPCVGRRGAAHEGRWVQLESRRWRSNDTECAGPTPCGSAVQVTYLCLRY